MKICTRCKIEKELDQFWYDKRLQRHKTACNECAAEDRRVYRIKNVEHVKAKNRDWQRKNPEKVKAANLRWRARNPGLAAKRTAEWRVANLEQAKQAQRDCNRKLKDAAYAAYDGYRCKCCGETTEAFLSIDHINNDGNEHRKTMDRRKIYKWLKQQGYPEGFQVLCMNCNFGKARNGGVCPHQDPHYISEGSTTIPKGSRAKRPEARGPSQEGEDIVSSAWRHAAACNGDHGNSDP